MRKMLNKKGFTLAELLIVVAIIAVLVAIAIPIFTNQLEKSKEATDAANVRSAIATLVTEYLTDDTQPHEVTVAAKQGIAGWQTSPAPEINEMINGTLQKITFDAKTSGNNYTVKISASGNITVE